LKVTLFSNSDAIGGASKACYRLHHALLKDNIDSKLYVNNKITDDKTVYGPDSLIEKLYIKSKPVLIKSLVKLNKTDNKIIHSPSLINSGWPKKINKSDTEIANIHWVQKEMLSIKDISLINKPLVWTLHDMWAFCGAEHVSYDLRWKEGYSKLNRSKYEKGFDLNRYVWEKKKKYWNSKIHLVVPSKWLFDCVKQSPLMNNWPLKIIPNSINTSIWKPINKLYSRDLFDLPKDKPILLFGSFNANDQFHKGYDLLVDAINKLGIDSNSFNLVIMGQEKPTNPIKFNFPTFYLGKLNDNQSLVALYSAVDLVLVPSRIESFSYIAAEAHSCGTPVVAFEIGGLKDIVIHKSTGYLAKAFDTKDFSIGIKWVLKKIEQDYHFGIDSRQKIINLCDEKKIAKLYKTLYEEVISESKLR